MFGVGTTELLIVCLIALLLFGNRLPSVMRSFGSSLKEFKRGMDDVHSDVRKSIEQAGREPHPAEFPPAEPTSAKVPSVEEHRALETPAPAESTRPTEPAAQTAAPPAKEPAGNVDEAPRSGADTRVGWDYERAMDRALGHQASGPPVEGAVHSPPEATSPPPSGGLN